MAQAAAPPMVPCPNCRQAMQVQELEQKYQGTVQVHLCFGCAGIWLDGGASSRLAPGAVIELFKTIRPHLEGDRRPVAESLHCPDCGDALALGYDLCKTGRFSYYRCARGDGRFTPFFQFLREKQFVRSLTPVEIEQVRAQVRQVRCSGCGAPIDLEKSSVCEFCHAPVSFLDKDAVEKAVQMWSAADQQRRTAVAPQAVAEALLGAHVPPADPPSPSGMNLQLGVDLVSLGILAIGCLLD